MLEVQVVDKKKRKSHAYQGWQTPWMLNLTKNFALIKKKKNNFVIYTATKLFFLNMFKRTFVKQRANIMAHCEMLKALPFNK